MKSKAIIGVGSNYGNRMSVISQAITEMGQWFSDIKQSHIYNTDAINGIDAPYLNAVISCSTELPFSECNVILKCIEAKFGRNKTQNTKGEIPLDLDIVVWNDEIIRPIDFSRSYFTIGYEAITAG